MRKNLKALVVEDDETAQFITSRVLEIIGIEYNVASNGIEALDMLKTKSYDFVLMDINMPLQDGLDTVRWVRDLEDPYFKELPIFAVTNYDTEAHKKEILSMGMNEHLGKPPDVAELKSLIEKYYN
ncbi:MAG: response regulator [Cyclobacteriaceae bacterium]|nr:response regulator [Cyclobacteriaceae bacterium]